MISTCEIFYFKNTRSANKLLIYQNGSSAPGQPLPAQRREARPLPRAPPRRRRPGQARSSAPRRGGAQPAQAARAPLPLPRANSTRTRSHPAVPNSRNTTLTPCGRELLWSTVFCTQYFLIPSVKFFHVRSLFLVMKQQLRLDCALHKHICYIFSTP